MIEELSLDEAVRRGLLTWYQAQELKARVRYMDARAREQLSRTTPHDVVPHPVAREAAQLGAMLSARTAAATAYHLPPNYGAETIRTARSVMTSSQTAGALRATTLAAGLTSGRLAKKVFGGGRRRPLDSALLSRVREMLDHINPRHQREANWWLPDDVEPSSPSWIRGLEEALPAEHRRSVDEYIRALEQWRALLHYRHRRVPDSPGRLVTARCHVPRGPNSRRLTSIFSQLAGPVVRI